MPLPIIYTDTPFGFREIKLGSLTVYTGKVRFKGITYVPKAPYLNVHYHRGYCIISFEVVDKLLADHLFHTLGKLCRDISQARLDQKWGWINS
jgi:hypothetical protein